MFGSVLSKKKITLISTLAGAVLLAGSVQAAKQGVPATFTNYLVFMANGSVPIGAPSPDVPGCGLTNFIFCDGQWYQENIMKRTQGEIDTEVARAKAYWLTRFGLDADAPANIGRLVFFSWSMDPRVNYRVYTIAGMKLPSEGWAVRDGGFALQVIDPNGIELGGDMTGQVAPPGALLLYGNYNIQKTKADGTPDGEIVIAYRSDTPMITNNWNELTINCQLSTDGFADGTNSGKAQGMGLPLTPTPQGTFETNWRSVLTFSDNHGL